MCGLPLSPDGAWIVFAHQKEGQKEKQLYCMDGAGTVKPLTNGPGIHTMATFSHDGKQISFTYTKDQVSYQVMRADFNEGSLGKIEAVTEEGNVATHPCFVGNQAIAYAAEIRFE